MRELAYYEAKFEALHEIMAADERVHLINGTFLSLSPHRHVFQDLVKKYGDRMKSPPISELGFCGLATGAAMAGLRPISTSAPAVSFSKAGHKSATKPPMLFPCRPGKPVCPWFSTSFTASAAAAPRSTPPARKRCFGTIRDLRSSCPLLQEM